MTRPQTEFVTGFDGARLAVHRIGPGGARSGGGEGARPVLLLHGLFSSAEMNWIKFGHAQLLADAGFEVFMPDLRAHGQSDAPHDPAAYPEDILVRDAKAVVAELGLQDYDMVGFSLGARTAVSCVVGGMTPRRLALCGMGLTGLSGWAKRAEFFLDAIDRFDEIKQGDPAYFAVQFMKQMKVDRVAARHLLGAVGDVEFDVLTRITMPTRVICGDRDQDNGSGAELAQALAQGGFTEIPGSHMSSVTKPHLGEAILEFLSQ